MKKTSALILSFTLISSVSLAEGLQNFEQNASQMGTVYAGAAAAAADASIGFFNPAGLILFKTRQVTYSTVGLFNNASFNGSSTWQSNLMPLNAPGFNYTQAGSANGGKDEYLPAFNEAIPLNNRFAIGLNVGIPFSFASDFSNNSILRYESTESRFYVVDITPSLAYLFTPKWSAGVGADFDYAHSDFDSIVGLPAPAIAGTTPTSADSSATNKANDWGIGWHGGVLYQYSSTTRYGLAYHSSVNFNMTGESELTGPITNVGSSTLENHNFNMTLSTPDSADFSIYHQLNSQWQLLGSIVYTDWNKLNHLNLNNEVYVINGAPVAVNGQVPLNLRNSWYTGVGANYLLNSYFTLQGGVAYDQSPTTRATSVMIPDANKIILGAGIQYNLNKMWSFNLGYQHWFSIDDSNRNTVVNTANSTVNSLGKINQNANLVGLQISWNIGML